MHDDDRPVGRVLTRREALKLLTGVSLAALVGCRRDTTGPLTDGLSTASPPAPATATGSAPTAAAAAPGGEVIAPACVVRPEMSEGPFFADNKLNRPDIRADTATGAVSAGLPLLLSVYVSQITGGQCTPAAGAAVDIWHCDARGVYSAFDAGAGADFLRGYQITDETGLVAFTTVYPGWYPGRTVHIHFKIRLPHGSDAYEFTSQLYFDDAYTDAVYEQAPYQQRPNRSTRNDGDGLYRHGGDQLTLTVDRQGQSYVSAFDIALDLSDSATGRADGFGRPGG